MILLAGILFIVIFLLGWCTVRSFHTPAALESSKEGGENIGPDDYTNMATWYHEKSKHSRQSISRPRLHVDLAARPEVYKTYSGATTIALPEPDRKMETPLDKAIEKSRSPAFGFTPKSISLSQLSTLLYMTGGITEPLGELRAAPSAGARYPIEIYIIANNVKDLPKGLYHYNVKKHGLDLLKTSENILEELQKVSNPVYRIENASVTLVFSARFYRSAWKYRDRAYRYCLIETGNMAQNSTLVLAAMGLHSIPIAGFDDQQVNEILGLDGIEEGPLLLLPVGAGIVGKEKASSDQKWYLRPSSREISTGKAGKIIGLIHGDTYLEKTIGVGPPLGESFGEEDLNEDEKSIPLPKSSIAKTTVGTVIDRRRSTRRFSPRPMELSKLSSILKTSFYDFAKAKTFSTNSLSLYLAVHQVDGLKAGVYKYLPKPHGLLPIYTGPIQENAHAASLSQNPARDANFLIIITIDASTMITAYGERGYRYASIMAGFVGENVYLTATAQGLGVVGIGAFFDDEISEIICVDPEKEYPIFILAIGER